MPDVVRPTVLLFDIDGTLVSAGGAGRRAIERAFTTHLGTGGDVFADVMFAGMTDPLIVRTGLGIVGRDVAPDLVEAILATYLEALADELPRADQYKLYPGVPELLASVGGRPRVAVGLGTGNLEQGARIKLARGGIDGHFAFGGFGSDHEERAEIIRIGAARGAAALGERRDDCRVVVIGDSLRDVDAALAAGAECVAVATSSTSPDELRRAGATRVVPDLTVPDVLPALLGT
ncbi:MAG TPA: HAD family hydrolase [Candidatus Binatia bacterium]|jgi:phosphoglycolate phosphatase-like HAD superfamily hydrolase|nr:HAD family hydrolase [Candidatus Binatia bacterium]